LARPFVSVLIDTYNHERFIEQAVVSALEQDFPPSECEIIVVDDGSTDATPEIVRKFEPRVRLVRKANGGQASAFNAGIPECRGEIVAFLDGDDWWAPTKLSRVAPILRADPEVGIVGHGTAAVYPDGRVQTEVLRESFRYRLDSPEGARTFSMRKSFLGTRSTIRSSILRRILPVPETIRIEADEFVFTMAAVLGDVQVVPEALFFYRIHADNFFSLHGFREKGVRLKQQSLAELAAQLSTRLRGLGLGDEAVRIVTAAIQVEADQLRLSLDGGYPWETVATELALYRYLHGDAPLVHRGFKRATLLPALVVPPRFYYRVRRWLAANGWYRRMRRYVFPVPQPGHVDRMWTADKA